MAPIPKLLQETSAYKIIDRTPEWVGPWMSQQGGGQWRSGMTCVGLARHGELVAGTMYDCFNGASIFTHIVINGPIIRKWLWYLFYYPFVQLDAKVMIGLVASDNEKSQNLCRHFGFELTSAIKDADPAGYLLVYTLKRESCTWIQGDLSGKR